MNRKKKSYKLIALAVILIIILFLVSQAHERGWISKFIEKYIPTKFSVEQAEDEATELEKDSVIEDEFYATSHKTEQEPEKDIVQEPEPAEKEQQPLTEDTVILNDIYTEDREEIVLKSYYPDAKEYKWEIYDISSKEWLPMDGAEQMTDELYRQISVCKVQIQKDIPIMVRCTTTTGIEIYTDIANIYVLEKKIENIRIEDYETEAGTYVSSQEIPVIVKYEDGSEENISGLYGLYFLEEEVNKEFSKTLSGNMTETTTTISTEKEYKYIGNEEKEAVMRYRVNDNGCMDEKVLLKGSDKEAPEIVATECNGYEISNVDIPVNVIVSIQAEDNETLYPHLEYAFLPEGAEIQEEDWKRNPGFEVEVHTNGNWVAYCRDQSGNIASKVQELIVVDQKAPDMEVKTQETEWCVNTKIIVEAKDTLSVKYHYSCPEKRIESGWVEESEYLVEDNGVWIVKTQDAVGNISEREIKIENIDKEMPVIHGIVEDRTE